MLFKQQIMVKSEPPDYHPNMCWINPYKLINNLKMGQQTVVGYWQGTWEPVSEEIFYLNQNIYVNNAFSTKYLKI